ncbi:lipocalin family protein [Saccharicrinis aurantiacus]|uniref:lipocalin family protein n=1 Tax=Saccharicrinis aurantiacus TaxID=1849719 RepID=UPI000AE7CC8A|nr:lipocalin family protein [Saccharicrinis aurantiacus]
MRLSIIILSFLLLPNNSCKSQNTMIDKSVVKKLDIDKYLGKWYEISRFDHSFERGMEGVTATYSMRDDGKIKVLNAGYKNGLDGKYSSAEGKAYIPNKAEPAKLKVSFFWFFYGDYFVLDLDDDYQWALIGSSSDKYLWILSRTPNINEDTYKMLINKLKLRGYDTNKLIRVKH